MLIKLFHCQKCSIIIKCFLIINRQQQVTSYFEDVRCSTWLRTDGMCYTEYWVALFEKITSAERQMLDKKKCYLHFSVYRANNTLEQKCRKGEEGLGKERSGNRRNGERDSMEVPADDWHRQLESTRKNEQPRSSSRDVRMSLMIAAGSKVAQSEELERLLITSSASMGRVSCRAHLSTQ